MGATTADQFRANKLIWCAIGVLAAIEALLLPALGLTLEVRGIWHFFVIMGACAAVSLSYPRFHKDGNLSLFTHSINQMIAAGFIVGLLSYISAMLNYPFIDESLMNADKAIGFHWQSYIGWIDNSPWVAGFFAFAYYSFGFQIILLLCMLFARKHGRQAQRFVAAFFFSGVLCVVLGGFFPALGPLSFLQATGNDYSHINLAAVLPYPAELAVVRAHTQHVIAFPFPGIVMFPSFHSVVAVLLLYAGLPFRRMRWVFIVLNVTMLMATPVNGGHYLMDVFLGTAIALTALAGAHRLLPRVTH